MQEIISCKQMHTLAYVKIIVDELSKKRRNTGKILSLLSLVELCHGLAITYHLHVQIPLKL
jgi:hypothetical protein